MNESVNAARRHFGEPIVIEPGNKMELRAAERKRQLEVQVQVLLSLEVTVRRSYSKKMALLPPGGLIQKSPMWGLQV